MEVNNDAVDALIAKLLGMKGGSRIPPLPPSTPPANGGGMEARIAVLEAHVEHIRGDLAKLSGVPVEIGGLKTDLAVLQNRVDHLPSKGFVATSAIGTVTALTAILILLAKLHILS